jgi:hypothetical protein
MPGRQSQSHSSTSTRLTEAPRSPLIAAALDYASRGWLTFPCYGLLPATNLGTARLPRRCACQAGAECKNPGKHPRTAHGFRDATTDRQAICSWSTYGNLAIRTGAESGLLIVDIDERKGGWETAAALQREYCWVIDEAAAVATGGGGAHLYYRYPRGKPIGSGRDVLGPGIDLKCDGGYVVVPPSIHLSGRSYRWAQGHPPARLPVAPAWLVQMARQRAPGGRSSATTGHPQIATKDHREGLLLAKLLGAKDRGSYWRIDCPVGDHQTPDAGMYARPDGAVFFRCFSGNGCTHDQIMAAVRRMLDDE